MRILVVDDHELVRKGICSVLATDPSITLCGEAADGREAVEKAAKLKPDIVVMDISMPRMTGLEATREIKQILPDVNVVIVSQHEAPELVRQAFNAGALGYVVKSSISADLLSAVAKVNQHEPFVKHPTPASMPAPNPAEILTKSAAVEKALRESEARFRSAMCSMAEGLYILDKNGLVTFLNPQAEAMLGWSSAELLGKKLHDVAHYKRPDGTTYPSSECPGLQVAEKGIELRNEEEVLIRKDGSFLPVMFSASPMEIAGQIVGSVMVFRDDSKRREEQRTKQEAEAILQERIAESTDELLKARNQLRGLSARLLQTQDEERRRIARELHDGVGQLLAAMNMNLATLTAEKSRLGEEAAKSVDENRTLVDQALRDIRTMSYLLHPPLLDEIGLGSALRWYLDGFSERSKIAVSLQIAPDIGKLPRDVELSLFRIVQECLTNIHRHSESPTAEVKLCRKDGDIALEVRDEGKGIPPHIHEKIISDNGFGLGLRGIRERLRQFGGTMQLQTSPSGTVVFASLPDMPAPPPMGVTSENGSTDAAQPAELAANAAQTRESANGKLESHESSGAGVASTARPATILCIDDEPAGMLARRLLLESAGHRVLEAHSGAEGIQLFKSEKIDAVVLDYWMSGMKGTKVAAELKELNPSVPIIVLSGLPEFPGEATGVVDEWLLKGNNRADRLLTTVKTLLERRAP